MKPSNIIPLLLWCSSSSGLWGQTPNEYVQTNKEVEYTYGAVAPESYPKLSDIEKIKYQLRYTERTLQYQIAGNTSSLEIVIDSTNTEEPWMNLAKRFKYTDGGMDVIGKEGNALRHIAYTEEQIKERQETKQHIAENGYHPGLVAFPEFNEEARKALESSGSRIEDVGPSVVKLIMSPDHSLTVDGKFLTITEDWTDADGLKNTELRAYEPFEKDKGFLLVMLKHERIRFSVNGPCITEVKLKYYSEYQIKDPGRLMDKAIQGQVGIEVFPNPNAGVFQLSIKGPSSMVVQRIELVHLITGTVELLSVENKRSLAIEKPQLPTGNYAIRVLTNGQLITSSFYKQ